MASKTCAKVDCGKPGMWHPVLLLRVHMGHQPAPALMNIVVCDHHKKVCTTDDFLTDQGWKQICAGFKQIGRQEPTRELTELAWEADS